MKKENHNMSNGMNLSSTGQSAQSEPEKEPMLLLDTTGSMNYRTSETESTPRKDTIREAISIIVSELAAADSQAAKEEEGSGPRTVTFSDGQAHDIADLNPNNLPEKWNHIRSASRTRLIPGFELH